MVVVNHCPYIDSGKVGTYVESMLELLSEFDSCRVSSRIFGLGGREGKIVYAKCAEIFTCHAMPTFHF